MIVDELPNASESASTSSTACECASGSNSIHDAKVGTTMENYALCMNCYAKVNKSIQNDAQYKKRYSNT